jgi:hypothetical protein
LWRGACEMNSAGKSACRHRDCWGAAGLKWRQLAVGDLCEKG